MNLATSYLGLPLRSPFVVGASPFCDRVDLAQRLEAAGAGAVVMRSLFEEQLEPPRRPVSPALSPAGGPEEFPEFAEYQLGPDDYLRQLRKLKGALAIPVIASLNGHRAGPWADFAARLEDAGADAIELNCYRVVTDADLGADDVEAEVLQVVGRVAEAVDIPVAVKLSPYYSALAQLALALEGAGADGLVLFNRFYQPDVNTADLEVHAHLRLSDPEELRLRLRWLAILSPRLRLSLAATGGVHSADDAVKAILTGAHVVQLASVLLRHGPGVLNALTVGLGDWMDRHGYASVEEFRGLLNLRGCRDATAFERANYVGALQGWKV